MIGQYTFIRKVGEGGYGEVWIVKDIWGRLFALKRLLDRAATFIDSLRIEVDKLFRVRDLPGVVQLVDFDLEGDDPYVVMDLADGSLLDIISGPLTPRYAAAIVKELALAVLGVHARGVVHRDLKPDNVLLKNGVPVVADFGLGKGFGSLHLTVGGSGTPGYMAPEQEQGMPTFASDIFGLGATFYHLLTGHRPQPRHIRLDPAHVIPTCPAELCDLVWQMTAATPAERPSLGSIHERLSSYLSPPTLAPLPVYRPVPVQPTNTWVEPVVMGAALGLGAIAVAGLLEAVFGESKRRRRAG